MPSICFVMRFHPAYKIGGAETQAHFLATELAGRGWRVHYVSESLSARPDAYMEESGLIVHQLPLRRRALTALYYPTYRDKLATVNADIYYQRVALPHTGLVARFAQEYSKQFVWASAHLEDCSGAKYVRAWQHKRGISWRRGPSFVLAWFNDRLVAYGIRRADARVTQTVDQRDLLLRNMSLTSTVIANGHPVPPRVDGKADPPLVVWIANMSRWKRPELFCNLAAACADLRAQFVMAGHPQEPQVREHVLTLAENLPSLTFLGPVSPDEAQELIGRARVFVNTSESEGFPNTFIQAWMRGTPVVSFFDPDGEIKRKALGYCPTSLEQMVDNTRFLLLNPSKCREIGERARIYAEHAYSLTRMVDQYEQLFRSLLAERP